MDNCERKKFWNILKNLHDNNEESRISLASASKWPNQLCRFRSVTNQSLQQLNENKLYFSSANYYDDPFDTYFYINIKPLFQIYEPIRNALDNKNDDVINQLHVLAKKIRLNSNEFVSELTNSSIDFPGLNLKMLDVRSYIQKGLHSICFCEDPYNETLWLKYASNYSGFVQVYDMQSQSTFLCGKEEICKDCASLSKRSYIYPVYYSDEKYDATNYALGVLALDLLREKNMANSEFIYRCIYNSLMWEPERISLIKKACHEFDREWRMIHPIMSDQRPCIKMLPSKVIIGLRTSDYESRLIVSAAVNAGIKDIHKLFINDADELDSKPVSSDLYHI